MNNNLSSRQIQAAQLLASGKTERQVCQRLGIGKGTIHRWKKSALFIRFTEEHENLVQKEYKNVLTQSSKAYKQELNETFDSYLIELKTAKERQKKWAAAITETGIRSLRVVNSYLEVASTATSKKLTKQEMDLVKLIPSFMRAASDTIRSSSDAEDKAYSLSEIAVALDELSQRLPSQSTTSDFKDLPPSN